MNLLKFPGEHVEWNCYVFYVVFNNIDKWDIIFAYNDKLYNYSMYISSIPYHWSKIHILLSIISNIH